MVAFAELLAVLSGLALLVPVFRVHHIRKRLAALRRRLGKSRSRLDQEFGQHAKGQLQADMDDWNRTDEFFLRLGLAFFLASSGFKLWIACNP